MNHVIFSGRLVADPEIKHPSDLTVANFTLAVDRRLKREGKPSVDYFKCAMFGKPAEQAERYFKKGMKLMVSGRIENDNFTDRDGNKRSKAICIVDTWEFAESKAANARQQEEQAQKTEKPETKSLGFLDIPDDLESELPFA